MPVDPGVRGGAAGAGTPLPGLMSSEPLRSGVSGNGSFSSHDGRTSNLAEAIEAHKSRDSEANKVIDGFNRLKAREQQDIINLLRFA